MAVKKTETGIVAQREMHAANLEKKMRKDRREKQDRHVQRKRALARKTKADVVGVTDEEGTDDDDSSPGDTSDEDGGATGAVRYAKTTRWRIGQRRRQTA